MRLSQGAGMGKRWLSKTANGLSGNKESVLAMLRQIAKARTEGEYENALNNLKRSKVWTKHEKLPNWITGTWLKESKLF